MKSRAIALGATVLALTLGGGAQATAAGLADLGQTTTVESGAGAQANAQLGDVQAKANLDANHWAKSKSGTVRQQSDADGALGVTSHANSARSVRGDQSVRVGASGGLSPRIEDRGKTTVRGDVRGHARLKGVGAGASAGAKAGSRLSTRHARASSHTRTKAGANGAARLARPYKGAHKARELGRSGLESRGKGGERFFPLHGIAHEVGNPLQLHAAWLLMLTTGICLSVARFARRRMN
jgi:hypothetical protein